LEIRRPLVNGFLKTLLDTICDIDNREYIKTLSGLEPVILAVNHINFLEVPILVSHSYPLRMTGLVKEETWKNPFMAFLLNTYKCVPINRKGAFSEAFKRVRERLDGGFFVIVAPEGTRSKNGVLARGKAGIIELALYTGAPILPVVHFGGERIWHNLKHFKRTPFCFKVGRPFHINSEEHPDKAKREKILNEVMGQMARLLPENMRGVYAEQALQETQLLEFL
jgi:1-acyl-sn-glycerol-3-phosphate acyltransferase